MDNTIDFNTKIETIKNWLECGSINIFGLPMSGKDTQGLKLAGALNGKFLSSGMIIRAMEQSTKQSLTNKGNLIPTNVFYEWVLPYFERRDLWNVPLILSSIGRWAGEEDEVMSVAAGSNHPIKAVILLNISEADVMNRWETAHTLNDRGARADDQTPEVFNNRLKEFREKTVPVLKHYKELGLLISIPGDKTREEVFETMINELYNFAKKN